MTNFIATRDAYGETLAELGAVNLNIVALDADLSKSTKTNIFAAKFPDRFFNCGIAEQNMIGVAAGLAACGKIPFVSSFAMFATGRAFEQIRNSVAHPNLNVKIAASHSGITVGEDGASHQTVEDIAIMRSLPNMTVIVPADAAETREVIKFAASFDGPVYIRLGRLGVPEIFKEPYTVKLGQALTLSEGEDVTIIACGLMVSASLEAASKLKKEGVNARVLNMPTIKPVDAGAIVAAAKETKAIVTCEEHSVIGGLGSAVSEVLTKNSPAPLEMIGVRDSFGESGTPRELLEKYNLTAKDIVAAAKKVIERKNS